MVALVTHRSPWRHRQSAGPGGREPPARRATRRCARRPSSTPGRSRRDRTVLSTTITLPAAEQPVTKPRKKERGRWCRGSGTPPCSHGEGGPARAGFAAGRLSNKQGKHEQAEHGVRAPASSSPIAVRAAASGPSPRRPRRKRTPSPPVASRARRTRGPSHHLRPGLDPSPDRVQL